MGKERMLITGGHALEGEVRVSGGPPLQLFLLHC